LIIYNNIANDLIQDVYNTSIQYYKFDIISNVLEICEFIYFYFLNKNF